MKTANLADEPEPIRVNPWLNAAAAPAVAATIRIEVAGAAPMTWWATKTFGTATGPLPVIWS